MQQSKENNDKENNNFDAVSVASGKTVQSVATTQAN
jgi:hypothetical protein